MSNLYQCLVYQLIAIRNCLIICTNRGGSFLDMEDLLLQLPAMPMLQARPT